MPIRCSRWGKGALQVQSLRFRVCGLGQVLLAWQDGPNTRGNLHRASSARKPPGWVILMGVPLRETSLYLKRGYPPGKYRDPKR